MIDNNILFFGHTVNPKNNLKLFPSPSFIYQDKISINKEIANCKVLWEKIIEEKLAKVKGRVVVPLSGGLDSRLILAGLLNHISAKEIVTYTFGPEKSLDFKIGNLIAEKIGTNHHAHAIKIEDYSLDNEIKWASILKKQISLFYHPPLDIVDEFKNDNLWVGFMGDPLAGSHYQPNINTSDEAINLFSSKYGLLNRDKISKYGIDINSIKKAIRDSTDFSQNISHFENLDFSIRQSQFIKPHIVYSEESTLPFIDQRWVNKMLALPCELRINERFYREFMVSSYKEIFSYPCKNNHGYSIASKNSIFQRVKNKFIKNKLLYSNYVNFDKLLKENNSLSNFVKELVFQQNYIEPSILWKDFINNELKYEFILNLASIQINTKLNYK